MKTKSLNLKDYIFLGLLSGRMTVFFAILLLVISSLGGAYLPFVISTMAAAVLSDLLLLRLGSERAIAQYISWPLGGWAVASIAFTVLLSLTGVWIARKILIKYIQPQEEELA